MGKLKGQNESVLIISTAGPSKMFLNEMAPRASMEVDHAQKVLLQEAPCVSHHIFLVLANGMSTWLTELSIFTFLEP